MSSNLTRTLRLAAVTCLVIPAQAGMAVSALAEVLPPIASENGWQPTLSARE